MKPFKHTTKMPFFIRWYMKHFKFDGLTTFWGTIYYIDEKSFNDVRLRKHEIQHSVQMNKDGMIWFHVKYLYYLIRYGYWLNPYEIEAREAENK